MKAGSENRKKTIMAGGLGMAALLCVFYAYNTLYGGSSAPPPAAAPVIAAQISAKPLRGLDTKLVQSTHDANAFYETRLPYADSQMLAEIGVLTKKAGVRWTHAQYSNNAALSGDYALTAVSIDASVSGDYRPIVQFINSVERDKLFFVINGINLTGQQTGQVNLRIRLTTYLRPGNADELSSEVPAATASDAAKTGGQP